MNKGMKVALVVLGILITFGLVGVITVATMVMNVNNSCVAFEKGIQAQYGDNMNVYDNYTKKVMEAAQIPKQYAKDLKNIYSSVIGNRYGKDGSKAMWSWIQEHNPTVDVSVYKQVQQIIESGRNEFRANQTSLLERKKNYETFIGVFPNNIIASMLRFPKIDLTKYDIVTSDNTMKAFETKKAEPLKVY